MKTNSTTRRELIQRSATALAVGAVAVPATVVSTVASAAGPDPIFALIEAHKGAMAESVKLGSVQSYELVDDAQTALLTTKPTTLAGAAAVLKYVSSFWIDGNDSSAKGLPVYEPLAHDDELRAGNGFLPMIAVALQQFTVV